MIRHICDNKVKQKQHNIINNNKTTYDNTLVNDTV